DRREAVARPSFRHFRLGENRAEQIEIRLARRTEEEAWTSQLTRHGLTPMLALGIAHGGAHMGRRAMRTGWLLVLALVGCGSSAPSQANTCDLPDGRLAIDRTLALRH